jgi:hypothetical protein
MTPEQLVAILLDEASVHLPRRGTRWVATFRDASGKQVWKATGLTDQKAALALAKRWEEEERRKRAAQGELPKKPTIKVISGGAASTLGLLSQAEVGLILSISERAVREIERRAFWKLLHHPALRQFWREWHTGEIEEALFPASTEWALSRSEIAAVYALAKTPEERLALRKLIQLTGASIECGHP